MEVVRVLRLNGAGLVLQDMGYQLYEKIHHHDG